MDWRVSNQFFCKYFWIVAIIAYIDIHTTVSSDGKTAIQVNKMIRHIYAALAPLSVSLTDTDWHRCDTDSRGQINI